MPTFTYGAGAGFQIHDGLKLHRLYPSAMVDRMIGKGKIWTHCGLIRDLDTSSMVWAPEHVQRLFDHGSADRICVRCLANRPMSTTITSA